MKQDIQQWLDEIQKAPVKKAIPILSYPCAAMLGITPRQLTTDCDSQVQVMEYLSRHYDTGACISVMDLSVEAEAFGCSLGVAEGGIPISTGILVETEEDALALKVPPVGAGRTQLYLDAVEKASSIITDRPVFAGTIGPFSLAGQLMSVMEAMMGCYTDPQIMKPVLEKATEFLIEYILAYKTRTHAAGVVMAEPLTGMLSPQMAEEFSQPYVRRIVDAVQDDSFLVIYHNCGNNVPLMVDSLLKTGCAAFHIGNAVNMELLLEKLPPHVPALGNIDPLGKIKRGTPQSVYDAVFALMERCTLFPNFIISSGCDIPPDAPWENVEAFFKAVTDFNAQELQF